MDNKCELFWYRDINSLLTLNNLTKFIPNKGYTLDENLNAVVRLSIYLSLVLVLLNNEINYLVLVMCSFLITFFIFSSTKKDILENYKSADEIAPSINNPFMNIMMDDYTKNPDRKIPDDIVNNLQLQQDIDRKFNHNLFKDSSDIYNKGNSQRQFYTMPVTTIPNKQKEFAEACYKTGETCREGNGAQCVGNIWTGPRDWGGGRGGVMPPHLRTPGA